MNWKTALILILFIPVFLTSCKDDDDSDKIALEERIFNAYLENNNITTEPTESGLYYIEKTRGQGVSPLTGNWVLVNYELYLLNGETMLYTYDKDRAADYGIYDERIIYGNSKLFVGSNIKGFDEGLKMMKEGGEAEFLFMSDLGYGSAGAGSIDPYSSLLFKVQLLKVIENPAAWEEEQITQYLTENGYTDIEATDNGLYYIPVQEGTGDSAVYNSTVTINVQGYLIDGRQFMDEELFRFTLGAYDYAVTEGLNEGVSYMKELGKAKLIVPYYLGYGVDGKSYYEGMAKVPIAPYSTLIYEIDLLTAK